jgi:peroxiredoxin
MAPIDLFTLPPDLPVPTDDGACAHLPGRTMPSVELVATDGRVVNLSALSGRTIVFAYPRTGEPGKDPPDGWDDIPGARGCTPESCGFRDLHDELLAAGGDAVFGLSTQTTAYQQELVARLHLPFAVLSDEHFALTDTLSLPTFEIAGMRLVKRLTLVIGDGRIDHVFYPIFPPDRHAAGVLAWLRATAAAGA